MGYFDRDYYGGGGGFRKYSFFPPVIKYLVIINAAVYFLETIVMGSNIGEFIKVNFALIPLGTYSDASFWPWQLITYQFMHGGFWHLALNMLPLWIFGQELENVWGGRKILVMYLFSGIGAGLAQLFIAPFFSTPALTVGASGSVFGIMVAFMMYDPERMVMFFPFPPAPAKYVISGLIIFQFLMLGGDGRVAYMAHIGGALTGFLILFTEKRFRYNIDDFLDWFKPKPGSFNRTDSSSKKRPDIKFRNPFSIKNREGDVKEASFYDINSGEKSAEPKEITQEEIDRILDKISQSGYQNLTENEKRVLFEASKKN